MTERVQFRVYEIEHDGDLQDAARTISRLGRVTRIYPDFAEESAAFEVEVADRAEFWRKARESDLIL